MSRHSFHHSGGTLACERSLATACSKARARKRESTEECPGVNSVLAAAFRCDEVYRHDLVLASFLGKPVLACIRCGGHSTTRVDKLITMCQGPPGRGDRWRGHEGLQRLKKWRRPDPRFADQQADDIRRLCKGAIGQCWLSGKRCHQGRKHRRVRWFALRPDCSNSCWQLCFV